MNYRNCIALTTLLLAACGQQPASDQSIASQPVGDKPAAVADATPAMPPGVAIDEASDFVVAEANGAAKCNIETIAGESMEGTSAAIEAATRVSLVGWYADPVNKSSGTDLKVVISNEDQSRHWLASVPARTTRSDVDTSLSGGGGFAESGFSFDLDLSKLPASHYGIYLQGSAGACGIGRTFEIK